LSPVIEGLEDRVALSQVTRSAFRESRKSFSPSRSRRRNPLPTLEMLEGRQLLTDFSGPITTNTTWTKANSPYTLTGTVEVRNGATLTIQSGVTVMGSDLLVSDDGSGSQVSTPPAGGVTFSNRLFVYSTGTASLSGDTFNNYAQFQLYNGGGGTT